MKILITGMLPWSVWTIAQRIARGGHQVSVIGDAAKPDRGLSGVHPVKLNLSERETSRYIAAAGFDAVIFFFACQSENRQEYGSVQGSRLDMIFDILHGLAHTSTQQFILVTDQRVFGAGQEADEAVEPIPDTPTGVMLKAAESCVSCGAPEGLRTLIVRTTSLYEKGDPESFFSMVRSCADTHRELLLEGDELTPCDFLHADDLGVLLEYALSMNLEGVIHACQGAPCTYGEILQAVKSYLPALSYSLLPRLQPRRILSGRAARSIGWVPKHDCRRELEELCSPTEKRSRTLDRKRRDGMLPRRISLQWAEILLLWALAVWLKQLGVRNALLATVDYMLLYVILIGFVHGRTSGLTSAVLACIWYGLSYVHKGGSRLDLLFNPDHWLPMSVYLLSGTLFGYARDRRKLKMELLEQERSETEREKDFMEGIYQRIYEDRNRLKEQIYHYRDSYGRIYQITRELDTLQPVQVFLSTLHVLESTLQNKSVSIYECKPETSYIRLVVRSREMRQLPKSLNMKDFAPMYEVLREGRLFANHNLMSGYPVYALPVMSGDDMLAILMLWNVPFDRQSAYLENLLSVVAGLVQSALVRAIQYHRQLGDLYYENTHILTPEAFRSALGIYQAIRQSHTGEHILVRLQTERSMSLEVIDQCIGKLVRSTDLVGQLDDGEFYVLFPQATTDWLPSIDARFSTYGMHCEIVSEDLAVE